MYERFYHLRERPFALSPDPEYLYPSPVHQEALGYLRYGVESQAGFIVITGEIGSGKTTLLQTLLSNLDSQTTVGRVVNTMLDPRELLETIMIDFGLEPANTSKPAMLRDLSQYLVNQRLAGRLVLLVIDEAQNLSLGALEELRMLSNLETDKSKLVQIVLVGQPNLRDKLAAPELEQLRQRITISYHLTPLVAEETGRYINHRLRHAAIGAPLEFPAEATDLIHARSHGIPRIINVICDAALVFGYAEERRVFDAALITEVLAELETTGVLPAESAPQADSRSNPPAAVAPLPSEDAEPQPEPRPVTPAVSQSQPGSKRRRRKGRGRPVQQPGPVAVVEAPVRAAVSQSDQSRAIDARLVTLEKREQALRALEQELAEQQRMLAEEHRRLQELSRIQESSRAGRAEAFFPAPAPRAFDPGRGESFWVWLKRIMLKVSVS